MTVNSLARSLRSAVTGFSVAAIAACSSPAMGVAYCGLTNFSVSTYDHTGVYLEGMLDGRLVSFLMICGITSGSLDCNSSATNRNLAVVLSAQARGKPLVAYFSAASSCASVANYTNVTALILQP